MDKIEIKKERLDRYSDFVGRHSDNGVYNPEKGLEGLLSTLTPDPKAVVLNAMENGRIYFPYRGLYSATLNWLENIGLSKKIFPLKYNTGIWVYCQKADKEGNIRNGSLVNIGAVVKEAYQDTEEGLKTGYYISSAGRELAIPLTLAAMEFVYRAKDSIPHKYDSMWRIFSSVSSKTEQRRQLAIYRIVKFLVENPKYHRYQDIKESLGESVNYGVISLVLNSLGDFGIIDYESPQRDVGGVPGRGWVLYSPTGKIGNTDEIYKAIRKKIPYFYEKAYIAKIIEFIKANHDSEYSSNEISEKLKIRLNKVTGILPFLMEAGLLKREGNFKSAERHSRAITNDLTKMLYDTVLEPAWYSASTLNPIKRSNLDRKKVELFLTNYQEERSNIGSQGGEEVRNVILNVLSNYDREMKLSHISEEGNMKLGERMLKRSAFEGQLKNLIVQGLVEKTKKGYYRLVQK